MQQPQAPATCSIKFKGTLTARITKSGTPVKAHCNHDEIITWLSFSFGDSSSKEDGVQGLSWVVQIQHQPKLLIYGKSPRLLQHAQDHVQICNQRLHAEKKKKEYTFQVARLTQSKTPAGEWNLQHTFPCRTLAAAHL
jgi:hypothetical protein